jgi:signal transduction histidine kinase
MAARFRELLDPRLSLGARIGWIAGLIAVLATLTGSFVAGNVARQAIERDIGLLYADQAQNISIAIDRRLSNVIVALNLVARDEARDASTYRPGADRPLADLVAGNIDDIVWAGIVDAAGTVESGSGGRFEGTSVAGEPWFKKARQGPVLGPLETLPGHDAAGGQAAANGRNTVIPVAVSIPNGTGPSGFLVAYFNANALPLIWSNLGAASVQARQAEILVYSEAGQRLLAENLPSKDNDKQSFSNIRQSIDRSGNDPNVGSLVTSRHLIGYARSVSTPDMPGTNWTVLVREPLSTAYAPARKLALLLSIAGLSVGAGLFVVTAMVTWATTRRLKLIALSADAMGSGAAPNFAGIAGQDEVARISRSLATLFNNLKQSNVELSDLNRDLDRKVLERTREAQRLADENRNAAIIRDRLRISRDLHDTLAHSMLAMLTQIRLIRKLARKKPELIEEELANAEQAAVEGLATARAAVIDLRYFAVRDDGLGPALRRLAKRLMERVEVEVHMEIAPPAASLAGPKAETVYRVAEEALHNIEKHANARHVDIGLTLDPEGVDRRLTLTIRDDGKGFDRKEPSENHFGLVGMREQADILGGDLRIDSGAGKGTQVSLTLLL